MNENQLGQLLQAINTLQDLGKVAYFNKGAYNSETTYEINDVITYQGSSYVSLDNNNQGNLPTNTTYWSIVALKGEKGDTGKPFVIEKTYSSVEDMVADYDNMNVNDYVMISGNIEEEQNATLWTKTETPAPTYKWVYLADFSGASGITGQTPNIQIGNVTEGNEPAVTRRQGSSNENPILDFVLKTGATGATGATGNGISSVSKTSTSGLTDTYTIAYTSGNSTTFDVTNGKGITSIAKTGTSGLVDTYTITYNDGTTSTFTITNGEDGEVTQAQLDEVQAELDRYKTLANVLPKTTGEGTEVTLNNCGGSLLKMQPKGNTEQNSYTGKNLFDKDNTNVIYAYINNSVIVATGGDSGSFYIPCEPNTTYTVSKTEIFGNDRFCIFDTYRIPTIGDTILSYVGKPTGGNSDTSLTITTSSTATYLGIFVKATSTSPSKTLQEIAETIQVEKNSSATEYEPYVGGTPSPNPDYPQQIEVVTGNNTIKQTGKNLFNASIQAGTYGDTVYTVTSDGLITQSASDGSGWSSGTNRRFTLNAGTYTISIIGKNNNNNIQLRNITDEEDLVLTNSNTGTFTLDETKTLAFKTYSGTYPVSYYVQIEKGSSATTYEPYQNTNYTLNLGSIELCKIGDYQDYIYKDNGKWYKHSEIGKIVLDGSENWSNRSFPDNSYLSIKMTLNVGVNGGFCNYFTSNNNYDIVNEHMTISKQWNELCFAILKNRLSTGDAVGFKDWLSTNTPIVYYVLATPTDEEITDTTLISQLNAINDALAFDGQNNISSEYASGNVPAIINAEAIAKFSN